MSHIAGNEPGRVCSYCKQPCEGTAAITVGDLTRYYHHGDDDPVFTPDDVIPQTCYEKAQQVMAIAGLKEKTDG